MLKLRLNVSLQIEEGGLKMAVNLQPMADRLVVAFLVRPAPAMDAVPRAE